MAIRSARVHAGSPDLWVMGAVGALLVVGLLVVYSSSFATGLLEFNDANYFIVRQVIWAALGLGLMVILMRSDYHALRVLSPLLMFVALAALILVLVPGIGIERNGAQRWIAIGPFPALQPSEFAKLALIVYVSAWLAGKRQTIQSLALSTIPFVVLVGFVSALILLQPDTGTAAIIVLTTLTLFFLAGASLSHLGALLAIGSVIAGVLLVAGGGYRMERIFAFTSAEQDPAGRGYQTLQLLIALGSGGVNGLGLGASRQKFFYLPGAHTDGAFAILGEELGFIGALAVVALFVVLIARGFRIVVRARDDFGALLAAGIVTWFGFQTLINLGGVTRSIPLTGIPVPFLSYGGSALAATLAGVGVLLSVSRYATGAPARKEAPKVEPFRPSRATSSRTRPARPAGRRGAG
ncbi:MAG TPA: putative lipid II flippase FtsW [Dehalococcoidia bacterium]|nr:putative lipid II flippase FtsW [Dehalococcoidia bacterium]